MMLLLAALSYGYSRVTVSRWHQTRSTQMDQLAARLLETVKDEIQEPVLTDQQKPLLDLDDLFELE